MAVSEDKARAVPDAERWPVDYDALEKGDVIGPDRLAEIVGEEPKTYPYQYKVFALAKRIEDALWERGKRWTVRAIREGIVVLTDVEASRYNAEMMDRRRKGLFASHGRLMAVDVGQLTEDQARKHDWHVMRGGVQVAALIAADRRIERLGYRRQHPRLPGTELMGPGSCDNLAHGGGNGTAS